MEYLVTARKWRPVKFEEVVGQEHITATLKNAIKNNRIAHAFLFTGPRGVGKTTTARILAKSLNCENPVDNEPCNECSMCKSISDSQSMDIIEIDGASNRGIDEIRTLRESVKYAPTRGKYKVYIIDEVHMLTKESFNAFLKTLEEPPSFTIFIFATTDVHKVPLTIISRCQRFDFRRIPLNVIKDQLSMIAKAEKVKIDDKTLTTISKKADGALRDAESYFDQVVSFCGNDIDFDTVSKMLNLIDEEIYFTISDATLSKNFNAVFETTDMLYKNGWDFVDFLDGLAEHFRNILSVIITQKTNLIESAEIFTKKYAEYIDEFSHGDLLRILNYINKTQQEMRYSQNQRLKIEIALTHLIGLEKSSTIGELVSGIIPKNKTFYPNSSVSEPAPKALKLEIPSKEEIKLKDQTQLSLSQTDKKSKASAKPKTTSTDLDPIVSKWQKLVDLIQKERALLLGSFINEIQIEGIEGSNITITGGSAHLQKDFILHEDYINKKAFEVFGKKMNINFLKSSESSDPKPKKSKEKDSELSELENIIINELGGEEIT